MSTEQEEKQISSPTSSVPLENQERRGKSPSDTDYRGPRTARAPYVVKPLEGDELLAAVQKQVEYYFSKENLQTDWYLRSQMNAEMFVPIKVIAEFRMVKALTTDMDLLISVMKNSPHVVLDETQTLLRPAVRAFRNTLILRDIPSSTDPEEVKSIFKNFKDNDGKSIEVEDISSDIGDCWYVTFANDDIALRVLESLRGQTFKGQPVQARIKTESTVKNVFGNTGVYDPNAAYVYPPVQGGYMFPPYQPYWDPNAYRGGAYDGSRGRGGFSRGRKNFGGRGGRNSNYRGNNPVQGKEPNGAVSTRKRRGSQGANINLSADFPPLPSAAFEQSKTRYTNDFTKYSKEDIVKIVSEMPKDSITKPNNEPDLQKVMLDEPNTELEVLKPYPKRATAFADIVMGTPASQSEKSPSDEKDNREEQGKKEEQTPQEPKVEKQEKSEKQDKQQEKEKEKKAERKEKLHKGEKKPTDKSHRPRSSNGANTKGDPSKADSTKTKDQKDTTEESKTTTEGKSS